MVTSVLIVLMVLVAIWLLSAQTSRESSVLSEGVAEMVATVPWIGDLMTTHSLEVILRKLAHGGIYFLLGIALTGVLISQRTKRVLWLVPLIGGVLAALDEFHQSFVPGRGPSIFDVLIDVIGVGLGMGLVLLVKMIYCHWWHKPNSE